MKINREVYETNVLIVGSGGAGLRSAIEAAKMGKVSIISRGPFGRGGATVMAGADIMLDGKSLSDLGFKGDPHDSKEKWFKDILVEGFELNNQKLLEAYVQDAPQRVKELLGWGMKVDPDRSEHRAVITTGVQILQALRRLVKGNAAKVFENMMAVDLLINDGRVCGAIVFDYKRGSIVVFQSKAVVLCTGGWHELYSFNTGSDELTGDGPAMAYRAGAKLTNMEMTTFCPNIILHPPAYRGSVFLYNLLPGQLLNSHGDAFLQWEAPQIVKLIQTTEWNKLLLSQACWREIANGRGTPHGGIYYSLKNVPTNLMEALENSFRWKDWRFQGRDFSPLIEKLKSGFAVEIGPAAHYFEGGIKINQACETNVPGLYAAGECTGELFGANRVSAATTEMLVQGAIAGKNAAVFAQKEKGVAPSENQIINLEEVLTQPIKRPSGVRASEIKKAIQAISYQYLGVIRNRDGLDRVIKEAEMFHEALPDLYAPQRSRYNRGWLEALEVRNLVELLPVVSSSALKREESRGVHYRSDFPKVDNVHWLKNIVVQKQNDRVTVKREPMISMHTKPSSSVLSYEEYIHTAIDLLG